jgi:hypothetical protein
MEELLYGLAGIIGIYLGARLYRKWSLQPLSTISTGDLDVKAVLENPEYRVRGKFE